MCCKRVDICMQVIAVCNFLVHFINIVFHICYYSLEGCAKGTLFPIPFYIHIDIGVAAFLFSMYNYFLLYGAMRKRGKCIYIWKICCGIETVILIGVTLAENVFILIHSNLIVLEAPFWCSIMFYIGTIADVVGHICFFILVTCYYSRSNKARSTSIPLNKVEDKPDNVLTTTDIQVVKEEQVLNSPNTVSYTHLTLPTNREV
mgnify:CR=1 FL=1